MADKEIAPVPRFKLLVPAKVKSPFKARGLVLLLVILPLEASIVPPLMVKVPADAPKAVALLIFNVPADKVVPAVLELVPESVNTPAFTVVAPV